MSNHPAAVYLWSRAEASAATWLGDHSTAQDVVLASTEFANPMVGVIDGRVVHGHIVATLHSAEKAALVNRFFAATTSRRRAHADPHGERRHPRRVRSAGARAGRAT